MCHVACHAQSCPTLCDPVDCRPPRLLSPWDSPSKNTGVGCHFLLHRCTTKWFIYTYMYIHSFSRFFSHIFLLFKIFFNVDRFKVIIGFSIILLLLSHFSHVQLCATPYTAAHQASPSLGFSKQEHWGGLPFPPPMHESEKWKWSCSVMSNSVRPHGLPPTRLLRPWDFPGKILLLLCYVLFFLAVRHVRS